jgi:hypothetical protein
VRGKEHHGCGPDAVAPMYGEAISIKIQGEIG